MSQLSPPIFALTRLALGLALAIDLRWVPDRECARNIVLPIQVVWTVLWQEREGENDGRGVSHVRGHEVGRPSWMEYDIPLIGHVAVRLSIGGVDPPGVLEIQ